MGTTKERLTEALKHQQKVIVVIVMLGELVGMDNVADMLYHTREVEANLINLIDMINKRVSNG